MSRSRIFKPSFVRKVRNSSSTGIITAAAASGSNIGEKDTFMYDGPGNALKSTQQLNIDWSDFSRHTFFNSAEAKTNTAFDLIINGFPFDGTREQLDNYFRDLTGFERYILESFPKNTGYLQFDSSISSYIEVQDRSGALIPSLADNPDAKSVLDHKNNPISFEMNMFIPKLAFASGEQIILQKKDASSPDGDGITISVNSTLPAESSVDIKMLVVSGTNSLVASMPLPKGEFSHICGTFNNTPGYDNILLYRDAELVASSSMYKFNTFSDEYTAAPLLIGAGTSHGIINPTQTLTGSIDELRVWHTARSPEQLKRFKDKTVYADQSGDLKLYFKFNEPSGEYQSNDIALDSSGNSLHARIENFTSELRDENRVIDSAGDTISSPQALENVKNSPVLFPSHPDVISLNVDLLESAAAYDANNPNLITKLVPKHYFLESQYFEGFKTEDGDVGNPYDYMGDDAVPGMGKMGSSQIMASLLFTWARFFDEIKMFLDHTTNILNLEYDGNDTVSDQFINFLAEKYGITMPNPFTKASIEQLFEGVNLGVDPGISDHSLQFVQNQLWRRVLINVNEIVRSKGTLHSSKSLMRSMGIDPDKYFRFREYGGSKTKDLSDVRRVTSESRLMLDMSGSNSTITSTYTIPGFSIEKPVLLSPFMSGSRIEVGYPEPVGSFVNKPIGKEHGDYGYHGISDNSSDGLYTSGSWTYESTYKFSNTDLLQQSLVRLQATGSMHVNPAVIANVVSDPVDKTLKLFMRPGNSPTDELLELSIDNINIQDGESWHVSFGRFRNDDVTARVQPYVSSTYFLSAGNITPSGDIRKFHYKTSLFKETEATSRDTKFSVIDSVNNASGTFFAIGDQNIPTAVDPSWGLGPTSTPNSTESRFTGNIAGIRFWSKALSETDIKEHIRDYTSLGVEDPLKNFNFVTTLSGSYEKLRLDASIDQAEIVSSPSGELLLFNYSQSGDHLIVTGLEVEKKCLKAHKIIRNYIDPKFDEHSVSNKVRIRGFKDFDNVLKNNAAVAPVYEILESERPQDDTRLAIDMSSVQALNEDMIRIFSTLDSLDNILGAPELLFATEYPDLGTLRDIYFNRLTDKINITPFFEFFKWFDSSIGDIIKDLIPQKTKFLGMNFVIESHMLERPKFKYSYEDIYLGDNDRHGLKGTITLQQYIANLRRY